MPQHIHVFLQLQEKGTGKERKFSSCSYCQVIYHTMHPVMSYPVHTNLITCYHCKTNKTMLISNYHFA